MKKILLALAVLVFSATSSLAHLGGAPKAVLCGNLEDTMQSFQEAWGDVYPVEILEGEERNGFLEVFNSIPPKSNHMASSIIVLGRPNMSAYCVVLFQGNMCVTWGCVDRLFVEPFLKGDKR